MNNSERAPAGSTDMHAFSQRKIRWTVTASVLLELALLSFARGSLGPYLSPLLLLGASLLTGWGAIRLSRGFTLPSYSPSASSAKRFLPWLLPLFLLLILTYQYGGIIGSVPLSVQDVSRSDIIPQVMVLVRRFLSGEFPYLPIQIWGYTLYPTYLPMQWLPFVVPELLGFDYRWMSFGLYQLAIFLLLWHARKLFRTDLQFLTFSLLPFAFTAVYLHYDQALFIWTIEALIAAYYLFFALSLFSLRLLPSAGALLLTLLSRFSIVLWSPFYFLALFFSSYRGKAVRLALLTLGGILLIYVFPFLRKDFSIFLNGYHYHSIAAAVEWTPGRTGPGAVPWHLYRGYGLAVFFYEFLPGSIDFRLHALQRIHFIISLLAVLLPALAFFRQRKRYELRIFLLGSLKIYLAVFYAFIQIPYHYLYLVPAIVALPILLISWAPLSPRHSGHS